MPKKAPHYGTATANLPDTRFSMLDARCSMLDARCDKMVGPFPFFQWVGGRKFEIRIPKSEPGWLDRVSRIEYRI